MHPINFHTYRSEKRTKITDYSRIQHTSKKAYKCGTSYKILIFYRISLEDKLSAIISTADNVHVLKHLIFS